MSNTGSSMHDITGPHKEVIDGKAYNTATSTLIHEIVEWGVQPLGHTEAKQLYKNRLGKWFFVVRNEQYRNPVNDNLDLRTRVVPLNQEDAAKWMEKYCPDKLLELLDVPEAGDPSATLSLRMSKELKIKLSALAIQEGISLNAWCLAALTRDLRSQGSQG